MNTAEIIDLSEQRERTTKTPTKTASKSAKGAKKKEGERGKKPVRVGVSDRGLTLCGAMYPLIKTAELADWLNYAAGGQATWTSDLIRDQLTKVGALKKLAESEEYTGSPRRPKARTTRRTYYTTLEILMEKLPEFYQALVRAADVDALQRVAGAIND